MNTLKREARGPASAVHLSLCILAACVAPGVASRSHPEADGGILRTARSQLGSDVSVWADSAGVMLATPEAVLQRAPDYPGLDVWRVIPALYHAHPLTVAKMGDRIVRLGGFPSPDLYSVASALPLRLHTRAAAESVAATLARLADRFGAVRYTFSDSPSGDSVLRAAQQTWKHQMPPTWPADSAWRTSRGTWRVTLTLLSQDTRSFNVEWVASVYSFEFDPDGSLVSWAKREAEPFASLRSKPAPSR